MTSQEPGRELSLRAFATRVLHGERLADKLTPPPRVLPDRDRGAPLVGAPLPGRPAGLALRGATPSRSVRVPGVQALTQPGRAGRLLHAFANHELLALELMALALLRFPDAPPAWRQGLLRSLADEQLHLSLYLDRMAAHGVELGEVPVNDFFWRCVADVPGPWDFSVRMGLVFEQANLDYTRYYRGLFEQVGDTATAAVLHRVHQDELRHVHHGLYWFRRGKPDHQSDWQAFVGALAQPLSPSRAKGRGYTRSDREQVGFDAEFIDELEAWARSRGRPPVVWCFQPACEAAIAHGGPGFSPRGAVQALTADLALLLAPLTAQEDVLLVPRRPAAAHLHGLAAAGLPVPELVEVGEPPSADALQALARRRLGGLRVWGPSPAVAHRLQPLAAALPASAAPRWDPDLAPLFAKTWGLVRAQDLRADLVASGLADPARWLLPAALEGRACASLDEVDAVLAALTDLGPGPVVLKAPWASSGQRTRRLPEGTLDEPARAWTRRLLGTQGAVVVEPWLERTLDLSLHLDVLADGRCRVAGVVRCEVSGRGQPTGFVIGRWQADLPPPTRRLLAGDGRAPRFLRQLTEHAGTVLGPRLAAAGLTGPVGVDALVAEVDGELRVRPLVEVNPRLTLGRVALSLGPRLRPGVVGLLQLVRRATVPAWGDWVASLPPPGLNQGRLATGVLPLTDLVQTEHVAAVLSVAPTLAEARAAVRVV